MDRLLIAIIFLIFRFFVFFIFFSKKFKNPTIHDTIHDSIWYFDSMPWVSDLHYGFDLQNNEFVWLDTLASLLHPLFHLPHCFSFFVHKAFLPAFNMLISLSLSLNYITSIIYISIPLSNRIRKTNSHHSTWCWNRVVLCDWIQLRTD